MVRQSIRNYNAFLKAARKEHGITLGEARQAYRDVTAKLGRAARGVDVSRHPRITKAAVKSAAGKIEKTAREKQRRIERIVERVKAPPAAAAPSKAGFSSLADYSEWFEEADDYEYEEAEGTTDYPSE